MALNDSPRRVDRSRTDTLDGVQEPLEETGAAIHLSRERIEAILDSLAESVVVADEHGRLQLFNRAAKELLGIGITDTNPDDWSQVYGVYLPDGQTPCAPEKLPLAQAIRGRTVSETELLIRNPNRPDLVPIRARATPIRGPKGELNGGVVVFHDITKLKRVERKRLENRIATLAENSPDAILIVDGHCRIVMVDSQTEEMFGYSRDELIRQPVDILVPPRHRQSYERYRWRFARSPRRVFIGSEAEICGRRRDGSEFPLEISISPLVLDNETYICGSIRNITERRRADQRLRDQDAKLAHYARLSTMGELAAGLAHEINQPLASIAAFAEGASLRIRRGSAKMTELAHIVDRIAEDAQRAGEVIRRLRQFVRRRDPRREPIGLNELAQEVIQFLRSEANHREVKIYEEFAPDLPSVLGDSIEIQQVMINLVRNAFDALMEQSPRDRRVVLRTSRKSDHVLFHVADSGPGVSSTMKQQVFEPFYTSKEQGLGMGLSISRGIVEGHGGRIWIGQSDVGGVAFNVELPIASQE